MYLDDILSIYYYGITAASCGFAILSALFTVRWLSLLVKMARLKRLTAALRLHVFFPNI